MGKHSFILFLILSLIALSTAADELQKFIPILSEGQIFEDFSDPDFVGAKPFILWPTSEIIAAKGIESSKVSLNTKADMLRWIRTIVKEPYRPSNSSDLERRFIYLKNVDGIDLATARYQIDDQYQIQIGQGHLTFWLLAKPLNCERATTLDQAKNQLRRIIDEILNESETLKSVVEKKLVQKEKGFGAIADITPYWSQSPRIFTDGVSVYFHFLKLDGSGSMPKTKLDWFTPGSFRVDAITPANGMVGNKIRISMAGAGFDETTRVGAFELDTRKRAEGVSLSSPILVSSRQLELYMDISLDAEARTIKLDIFKATERKGMVTGFMIEYDIVSRN